MLPTSKPHRLIVLKASAASAATGQRSPQPRGRLKGLAPIGPERLRALREAIEAGTYPSDEDVIGGLTRLFTEEA